MANNKSVLILYYPVKDQCRSQRREKENHPKNEKEFDCL